MTKSTHYYMTNVLAPRIRRGDELGESKIEVGGVYAVLYQVRDKDQTKLGIKKSQWGIVKILPDDKAIGYNLKGNYGKVMTYRASENIGHGWHLFKATPQEVSMMAIVMDWTEAFGDKRRLQYERDRLQEERDYLQKWVVDLKKHHNVERLISIFIFVVSMVAVSMLCSCSGHPQTKPLPELHEEELLEVMPPEGNPEDYDSCYITNEHLRMYDNEK